MMVDFNPPIHVEIFHFNIVSGRLNKNAMQAANTVIFLLTIFWSNVHEKKKNDSNKINK